MFSQTLNMWQLFADIVELSSDSKVIVELCFFTLSVCCQNVVCLNKQLHLWLNSSIGQIITTLICCNLLSCNIVQQSYNSTKWSCFTNAKLPAIEPNFSGIFYDFTIFHFKIHLLITSNFRSLASSSYDFWKTVIWPNINMQNLPKIIRNETANR